MWKPDPQLKIHLQFTSSKSLSSRQIFVRQLHLQIFAELMLLFGGNVLLVCAHTQACILCSHVHQVPQLNTGFYGQITVRCSRDTQAHPTKRILQQGCLSRQLRSTECRYNNLIVVTLLVCIQVIASMFSKKNKQ